jgi:hypothetical protein
VYRRKQILQADVRSSALHGFCDAATRRVPTRVSKQSQLAAPHLGLLVSRGLGPLTGGGRVSSGLRLLVGGDRCVEQNLKAVYYIFV